MKHINADRLKEEFQKRFDICKRVSDDERNALDTKDWYRGKYTAYSECLSFIDSLQQGKSDVDLEKELADYCRRYYNYDYPKQAEEGTGSSVMPHIIEAAKYFYELGLNARKL